MRRLGPRPHEDYDPLRLRVANVVEQLVAAAGELREVGHGLGDDLRALLIERVAALPGLEERIWILGRAPDDRTIWSQGATPVLVDLVFGHEGAKDLIGYQRDLRHFVGGAKAVEEVHERHARSQRGHLPDGRQVVSFLRGPGCEQPQPGLPARHDVRVVTEDGQCVRRNGSCGHMHAQGIELACDLVEVGQHEQQPLRCGEGGGQRPALKRAVDRACGATFGLHLDHLWDLAPQVGLFVRRPLIRQLAHG